MAILLLDKKTQPAYNPLPDGLGRRASGADRALGTTIGTAAGISALYTFRISPKITAIPRGTRNPVGVAIPLMVRDEVVGVLDCQSENADHFDRETVDLLTLFSTQASMALQNARLYSLERRRASQLEAINAIARETTVVLDIKNLLSKASEKIQKAFQVSHVSVLLKDDDELVLRAHYGDLTLRIPAGGRLPADTGLLGRAISENKTLIENDIKAVPDYVGIYLRPAPGCAFH